MIGHAPQIPVQTYDESDEDFADRYADYEQRYEVYDVACDMAVDAQREREAFGDK